MLKIAQRTYIKVSPEEVYRVLTTAEGWNSWFTDKTEIELGTDGKGKIRLRWTNFGMNGRDIEDGGKILEAIPNQSFIFQWSPGEKETTISIKLKPYKEGTLVTLNESGYSNSEIDLSACLDCASGWGEALTLLKFYLEYGIVCKRDVV